MNEADITIAIPGAAGSGAIGAIKSLRRSGFTGRIVSTDGEPLAAGFFLSDAHLVTYSINELSAYSLAREFLIREKVNVILPTSASDTPIYAARKLELKKVGITFAGCDEAIVNLCDDKRSFYESVRNDFPVPSRITVTESGPLEYPCFLKPRRGSGGHGCKVCYDVDSWRLSARANTELMAQEILPGREYSVDVLCDLTGQPLIAVPRERLAILDGISIRAKVIKAPEIEAMCLRMASYLGIKGACCMQLKEDQLGRLKFLEVNPRIGGSTIITTLAGLNIPRCLVAMATDQPFLLTQPKDILVVRYFDELIVN